MGNVGTVLGGFFDSLDKEMRKMNSAKAEISPFLDLILKCIWFHAKPTGGHTDQSEACQTNVTTP